MCRSASPAAILQAKQSAMDLLMGQTQGTAAGPVACRAAYRLAHYSDSLYCSIHAQKTSPEYKTALVIVKEKQQQARWLLLPHVFACCGIAWICA